MEIRRIKSYYAKILFGVGFATALSIYAGFSAVQSETAWIQAMGYLLLLFALVFVVFGFNSARQMLRKAPALRLLRGGLEDNVTMADAGLIPWKDIQKVERIVSNGIPHLFVFVRQPDGYIDKHGFVKKGMLGQIHKDHGSPIAIDFRMVDISEKELIKQLKRRLR